jgi:hydroxymethylbilane synthase
MNKYKYEAMSSPILRIASRESKLALWQTNVVMAKLHSLGFPTQLVPLKTSGDIDLVSPIYAMGVTGVFTKELDTALLSDLADLAVHSLKDIPTILSKGLIIAAVLERASAEDILVHRNGFDPEATPPATIATSSIRRRSQWLHRFSTHTMVNVRGNVETRLKKFRDEGWDGIIFAKAGLERLGLLPEHFQPLSWMTPAPAQGAIAVVCRAHDEKIFEKCRHLNHDLSEARVTAERAFLYHLEGGCSVPISAVAEISDNVMTFTGAVHSLDGTSEERVVLKLNQKEWGEAGKKAADLIRISQKGKAILEQFRKLNRAGI